MGNFSWQRNASYVAGNTIITISEECQTAESIPVHFLVSVQHKEVKKQHKDTPLASLKVRIYDCYHFVISMYFTTKRMFSIMCLNTSAAMTLGTIPILQLQK